MVVGDAPPVRAPGYGKSVVSMRLMGGMGALIDAQRLRLKAAKLALGQRVRGVRIAGHEPFRLVRAGALSSNRLLANQRTIWNLLELARTTSTSGDHGLVVVPHLEMIDEVPEAA